MRWRKGELVLISNKHSQLTSPYYALGRVTINWLLDFFSTFWSITRYIRIQDIQPFSSLQACTCDAELPTTWLQLVNLLSIQTTHFIALLPIVNDIIPHCVSLINKKLVSCRHRMLFQKILIFRQENNTQIRSLLLPSLYPASAYCLPVSWMRTPRKESSVPRVSLHSSCHYRLTSIPTIEMEHWIIHNTFSTVTWLTLNTVTRTRPILSLFSLSEPR